MMKYVLEGVFFFQFSPHDMLFMKNMNWLKPVLRLFNATFNAMNSWYASVLVSEVMYDRFLSIFENFEPVATGLSNFLLLSNQD